jgi:hypothetical protein
MSYDGDTIGLPMDQLGMTTARFRSVENRKDARKIFSKKHNLIYDAGSGYLYLNGKGKGIWERGVLAGFEVGTALSKGNLIQMPSSIPAPSLIIDAFSAVPDGRVHANILTIKTFPECPSA